MLRKSNRKMKQARGKRKDGQGWVKGWYVEAGVPYILLRGAPKP